jgi:hypothetical protein
MFLKSLITALVIAGGSLVSLSDGASAQQPRSPLANVGNALQPVAQPIPAESVLVQLVSETIDIFLEAVKARSMQLIHEHASINLKREFTVEQLNQAFSQFFQIPVTGKPIANLSPIFTQPATAAGANAFKVVGHFATRPSHVHFDITYLREGTGWKWVALNVRVAPPGQSGS